MTSTRYIVEWTPTAEVKRAARKRGMTDGDGTSFWDWIGPEHCAHERVFPSFGLALAFARKMAPRDVFGCPRIERERLVADHDDLGNVFRTKSWEADARWEVQAGDTPTEADPDILLEAA